MTKRGNKLIVIFVAVIMSATFLLTCFSVFGAFLKNKTKEVYAGTECSECAELYSNAYNFDNGSGASRVISSSDYNNNTNFIIDSWVGLETFQKTVGAARDNSFEGKVVHLTTNLYLSGYSMDPIGSTGGGSGFLWFEGIFNGHGHFIDGLHIKFKATNNFNGSCYYGFFGLIDNGSQVLNLQLLNCTMATGYVGTKSSCYGFIAGGFHGGLISNCSVINCSIKPHINSLTYTYIGGIVGGGGDYYNGSLEISNCYVENLSSGKLSSANTAHIAGIGPARNGEKVTENVKFSVVNGVTSSGGMKSYAIASNGITQTSCYSSQDEKFVNLSPDLTQRGPFDENQQNYWYLNEKYSNGWPCLRIFQEWTKIDLEISTDVDVQMGYFILDDKVYDDDNIYLLGDFNITITNNNVAFNDELETQLVSEPNEHYYFIEIIKRGDNKIIATFKLENYTISFKAPQINGVELDDSKFSIENTTAYYINYGSSITLRYSYVNQTLYITYQFETTTVTYIITDKTYAFDKYDINNLFTEETIIINDLGNNGTTVSVTPTLKLKQYNITFG